METSRGFAIFFLLHCILYNVKHFFFVVQYRLSNSRPVQTKYFLSVSSICWQLQWIGNWIGRSSDLSAILSRGTMSEIRKREKNAALKLLL